MDVDSPFPFRSCHSNMDQTILPRKQGRLVITTILCIAFAFQRARHGYGIDPDSQQHPRSIESPLKSPSEKTRNNCQIIYVLGVEGSTHHGFYPVLEALAENQVDPGMVPYDVHHSHPAIKKALLGFFHGNRRSLDDPTLVNETIHTVCPNDGKKHILIESCSFPSGVAEIHSNGRTYRVRRQKEWSHQSMEEIADSEEANNHPLNLYTFYETYSPYADIKFIVLHRPYLETIASHFEFDGGFAGHSNVIGGYMLLLRRFLDSHLVDFKTGGKLWTLICVESISSKFYQFNEKRTDEARRGMISHLVNFLSWPQESCPHCFDSWHESTKDYTKVLGEEGVSILAEHMTSLEGVWPPVENNGWQQCGI